MFKTSGRASFLIIIFQFLQYYVFVVLSGDAFALFHWHFYCDSFTREEDCIQNLLCTQRTFGNYWAFAVFSGPDLIANLSDGLKIMDPGFITCDDIGKLLFVIILKIWSSFLATLTRCLFCSSVNRCGTHLAEIFLTFKCFFKIRWTVDSDMPTFRNITNCKSGISFNDFLYFGNDFFTRCRFWPTWFRCIFDGLYTRLKFLFPPPNCVIRHTRRSKSSRNFSHQLLQRTTKFWASFDVSPYFIFLSTLLPTIFTAVVNDCVYSNGKCYVLHLV